MMIQFTLLTDTQHVLFNRLAILAAIYLIYDAYIDLKKNRKNKRAWIRLGIGIATFLVDFYVLKSYGASILPGA